MDPAGSKIVSQAGGLLLTEIIRTVWLDAQLSAALAGWRHPNALRVSLVGQYGSKHLDPRDRGLIERIAALPEVAPSPEEEAHTGDVDAAITLAAQSWMRGASDEADRWCELAREGSATAVLYIAFSMTPREGHYSYEDDGLRARETDRVQGFVDAASWLQHRAERGDPLARDFRSPRVRDTRRDRSKDRRGACIQEAQRRRQRCAPFHAGDRVVIGGLLAPKVQPRPATRRTSLLQADQFHIRPGAPAGLVPNDSTGR